MRPVFLRENVGECTAPTGDSQAAKMPAGAWGKHGEGCTGRNMCRRKESNMELNIQVPKAAEEILEKLNNHGFEAYVVGGCVRDSLLGRRPGDWDITTSARPEEVKAIFGRTIDTGIQHGTVTIMKGKEGYEVTTYRIDGEYEDGRHPKEVAFTSNLLEDLKRRDFTINAMAYSHRDGLVDAFGGIEDLKQGRIRCVGNAMDRFTEDALRILRAVRFSAQLGFEIETETWNAIRTIAPNLVNVSKERIQVELTKLLTSNHPEAVQMVFACGMEKYISETFAKLDAKAISISTYLPAWKYLRWAACLKHQTSETAVKVLKELKLDNDTMSKVKTLVQWWRKPIGSSAADIRRTMSQMSEELFDSLLMLKQSIVEMEQSEGRYLFAGTPINGLMPGTDEDGILGPEPAVGGQGTNDLELTEYENGNRVPETLEQLEEIYRTAEEIYRRGDCISLKMLAVTGNDLIQAGMKPGKQLGETLNRLFALVLENPELNQKERLLQEIGKKGFTA